MLDLNHGGVLLAESTQYYGPFIYKFDNGFPNYQEPEGIDYFNTAGRGISNVPESQLHVILYSNREGAIWLNHYQQ